MVGKVGHVVLTFTKGHDKLLLLLGKDRISLASFYQFLHSPQAIGGVAVVEGSMLVVEYQLEHRNVIC